MKWMADEITFAIVHTVVLKMSVTVGIWMNPCNFYGGYFYQFYDVKRHSGLTTFVFSS